MAEPWKLDGIGCRLEGLMLPSGLCLDEIVVTGTDVSVSVDPVEVSLGSDAEATVRVSCESIKNYLSRLDLGGLRDLDIKTDGGLLLASATAVVIVAIRARVWCSLQIVDGKSLVIRVEKADPGAAHGIVEKQLAGVNPVFDLSGLPVNVAMESVEIADGWVTLSGTAV